MYCFCMLIAPFTLFAQSNGNYSSSRYSSSYSSSYSSYSSGTKTKKSKSKNDCLNFYYEVKDSNKAIFKSVAKTEYNADDSTLRNKRFGWKSIAYFNKKGEELFWMSVDSDMVVTDSIRYDYDSKFNLVRERQYRRNDSTREIDLGSTEIWAFDDKGREIKDSTYKIEQRMNYNYSKRKGGPKFLFKPYLNVTYTKYNSNGDAIEEEMIKGGGTYDAAIDTTYSHYTYDGRHNMIYSEEKRYSYSGPTKEYYRYNDSNNVVFSAYVDKYDSSYAYKEYDKKEKLVKTKRYRNNELSYIDSMHYEPDGRITETEEHIYQGGPTTCAYNEVTVTVYDTGGRELSISSTTQKNGKPFMTSTVHKFMFDRGHVVIDSSTTIGRGHLYALTSRKLTTRKYDKDNNEVEYTERGGGQYADNLRKTWSYNAQGNETDESTFNSCVADRPEKEWKHEYYPDGKKIKQVTDIDGYETTIWYYPENSRVTKKDVINGKKSFEIVYEYKD